MEVYPLASSVANRFVQLLQEIEQKAAFSQQQIGTVKGQIAIKTRDRRKLQLTASELGALPSGTNVYEGVGKMFVWSPTGDVEKKLTAEADELEGDVKNLEKKLHYLETTYKNSRASIEQLFKNAGR